MTLLEAITRAREQGELSALIEKIPYALFLGLGAELREGRVVGTMRFSPMLIGNPTLPALHGGAIGALLEWTAIFDLLYRAETLRIPKTINITVEYLRSGRPLDTFARAEITKQGRQVASVRAIAWQTDPARPIAAANLHFLLQGLSPADAPLGAVPPHG
ncbi:MAG: PaaI family thioesterase [Myxococcales bacterium]|nr:PaaI family thioesterase [Myxococcales bacterium]